MLEFLFGLFLIALGFLHTGYGEPPDYDQGGRRFFEPGPSWLTIKLGLPWRPIRRFGTLLVVLASLGFALAGLGFWGFPILAIHWETLAVTSALASLVLVIVFWQSWLFAALLLDVTLLAGILWAHWPLVGSMGT